MQLHISQSILNWIAQKNATDLHALAEKIAPKKIEQFIQGILNKSQAEELAKLANIPFGFLFLDEPPKMVRPTLPDFRTVTDSVPLSNGFDETLEDILDKQAWFKEYLQQIGELEELPFIGRFSIEAGPKISEVAENINLYLADSLRVQKNRFQRISEQLEKIGILVFKNGIVGSNTRKALDVKEFRGFAIADKEVPIIFINGKDADTAQLFTLMHEVVHIWLGASGISSAPNLQSGDPTEQFCNKVAAKLLMPDFEEKWQKHQSVAENFDRLAKFFEVSQYAVAIQAKQTQLINQKQFNQWNAEREENLQKNPIVPRKEKKSGGDYYKSLPIRNSKKFTQAVATSARNGSLLIRDGARLLNTSPDVLVTYYRGRNHQSIQKIQEK